MTTPKPGDIVRMKTDNDDLAHVAGIVGTITDETASGELLISAHARQFSPHVGFDTNPFYKHYVDIRIIWACAHEFTILN